MKVSRFFIYNNQFLIKSRNQLSYHLIFLTHLGCYSINRHIKTEFVSYFDNKNRQNGVVY